MKKLSPSARQTFSIALFALFAGTSGAQASTVYLLTQDACTGTCGTDSPFATVTLTNFGTGSTAYVQVTEFLNTGENYSKSSGEALEFNLLSAVTNIVINNVTTNFAAGSGGASASAFGSFTNFVSCSSCQGGNGPSGPMSFDVSATSGGVTTADFTTSSKGYFFASDIMGNNGNTGNVGDNTAGTVTAAPEPASLLLSLSGLAAPVLVKNTHA